MRFVFLCMAILLGAQTALAQSAPSPLLLYQQQLIDRLSHKHDAPSLHTAALLAAMQPDGPSSWHPLLQRAIRANAHDAAIHWTALADCNADQHTCPNPEALQELTTLAPDNMAVWMMALGASTRDKARLHMLQKMAAANTYDDYSHTRQQLLLHAMHAYPPPAALYQDGYPASSAAAIALLIAYGLDDRSALPGLQSTAWFCERKRRKKAVRQLCQTIGDKLQASDFVLARSLGIALQHPDQDASSAARMQLTWTVQQFMQLLLRSQHHADLASQLLQLAADSTAPLPFMRDVLRTNRIALHPPQGWTPPRRGVPTVAADTTPESQANHAKTCAQDANDCIVIGTTLIPSK